MKNNIKNWLEANIPLFHYDDEMEEKANGWTHLLGALLSLLGMIFLVKSGIRGGDMRTINGFIIFSSTMVLLFAASGFYHMVKPSILKRLLRLMDHCSIYILIAGTYTPLFIAMDNPLTDKLLLVVWLIALAGIVFTFFFFGRFGLLNVALYLAMGWMVVFVWDMVMTLIPLGLIKWVIAGGVLYTVGTLFYAIERIKFNHAIWHLFVLGGSGSFYMGILKFLPLTA